MGQERAGAEWQSSNNSRYTAVEQGNVFHRRNVLLFPIVQIKSLQKSGAQITNIVVTDNNIKSFDRVARKYGIDYSLKKVEQEGKSEYLVFFKAKDVDIMTAAFKEYTNETMKKQKRESVRQKLEKVKEELSNHRQLKKEKKREQEPIR